MIIGDITRMECFRCLPKWGMRWYKTSLEINREEWTLNSVTPIILANLLWAHPIVPIQVFFIAVWISCIADAFTSLIGKNFGKRKWGKKTAYPEKTVEGTFAGTIITVLGSMGILLLYPLSVPSLLAFIVIPLGCAFIFLNHSRPFNPFPATQP